MEVAAQGTVDGDERFDELQRQIVAGHRLKNALIVGVLQVQIARSLPPQINASQQGQPGTNALHIHGLAAEYVASLTLLNEAVTEVGAQGQCVVAIEAREGELALVAELPVVGGHQDDGVRDRGAR
jgi:hypothetical protein